LQFLIAKNRFFQEHRIGMNFANVNDLPSDGHFDAVEIDDSIFDQVQDNQQQLQQQIQPESDPNDLTAQAAADMSTSSLLETPLRLLQNELRDRLIQEQLGWQISSREPINEFSQTGLLSLSFPHLFPTGDGDYQCDSKRPVNIDLGDYAQHLMRYHDSRFRCDPRFKFLLQNMIMRWRALACGRIYFQHNQQDKKLNAAEMCKKLQNAKARQSVFAFSRTLRGSRAYWFCKRRELETMIQTIGVPHLFVTLSSADRYWPELREFWLAQMTDEQRLHSETDCDSVKLLTDKLIADPAVADTIFWKRFEIFVSHFFQKFWGVTDFWFRVEYQSRGSPHVHGVVWLPDGVDLRDSSLTAGRFRQFVDKYVTCWNTGMVDGEIAVSTPQTDGVEIPASLKVCEIADNNLDLAVMVNMSLRHTRCGKYCQKTVDNHSFCRFKYPRELQVDHSVVEQLDFCKWRVEPMRNDALVASYNPQLLSTWRANVDVQPIRSPSDVARYLVKYAAKSETKSPHLSDMYKQLPEISNKFPRRECAQRVVQQLLISEVNSRDYSAQEASHLLLQLPLIKSSRDYTYR
jgi:hypothetical protein